MALTRCCGQGRPVEEVRVVVPPTMNTMEQLLAVQNVISKAEVFVQDMNIVLLKIRALLLAIFPQVCSLLLTAMNLFSLSFFLSI